MKRWALALLVATGATALAGCARRPRVSLGEPKVQPTSKDYEKQLKRWTRHGQLMSDFDQALQVDATLRSPEFRAAYAAKYIEMYKVEPESQPKVRGDLLSDGADSYEFHVESATHDYLLNDLTGTKSVWRVTLVDDQAHEVTPSEVSLVRERRRLEMEFYPYADIFSKGWRVRFPRARADGTPVVGSDTKSLTLRMAGPQGAIDLVWQLQP
jgi:hypothetical protein